MGGHMPAFLIILFVAVAGTIACFAWLAEKRRREEMAKLASSNGLEFSVNDPYDLPNYLAGIATFNRGHSRKAYNVIHGPWHGREVIAFDYQYTTGSGKNRTTSPNPRLKNSPRTR